MRNIYFFEFSPLHLGAVRYPQLLNVTDLNLSLILVLVCDVYQQKMTYATGSC